MRGRSLALGFALGFAACDTSSPHAPDTAPPEDAATTDAPADAPPDVASDTAAGDAALPPSLALRATSGWQIYAGGGYRYGPSIIVDTDGSIHLWTCSPGSGGAWDFIRYRHSTDGGHSWTPDVVALQPTPGTRDAYSTCDPGAVVVGSYWYVGYTSTEDSRGTSNQLYVARSTSPSGPFDKWNGSGWGGAPQPIVAYKGDPAQYGIGEPSMVLMGTKLFVYYSYDDAAQFTNVATVDDATAVDWPLHLVDHGHAIARARPAQDSADVKYVDALARFVAVTTYDRFGPNATIGAYQSLDGLAFEPAPYLGARVQQGAHNVGISGDRSAHLDVAAPTLVAYAYQPAGSAWGDWPTYLDPVKVGAAPWGTTCGGEVSSIVGGGDWNWSGPRAWDGDTSTIFSSVSHGATDAATEWAMVDAGGEYAIAGVTLVPRANGYGFPVDFSIQSSNDASAWADVAGQQHTGFANPGGAPVVLSFSQPVKARWLRVLATRLGTDDVGQHYLQLAEMAPVIAP